MCTGGEQVNRGITDVPGIRVGQLTDPRGMTGCTVVLGPKEGAVAGVDVRGSAPGTRETDLLRPMNLVQRVHAVMLCGGSAFGLDAAAGVMQYLEECNIGFETGFGRVPIVSAAVLYDLAVGDARIRPNREMGYQACLAASTQNVQEGNCGAGTGASVAKYLGMEHAMKGGIGTHSVCLSNDIVIGAITAVNAFGDIMDWRTGHLLAAPRMPGKQKIKATVEMMKDGTDSTSLFATNTTLSVVATNAHMTNEAANKVAQVAHNGLARSINPVHTMADGDIVFALSTGNQNGDLDTIAAVAAEVVAESIRKAVMAAESVGELISVQDFWNIKMEQEL